MESYTMSQVETLTGISAHKLRMWERRYNFLTPERSSSNIRFYSDAQLRKLLNVGILTRNGFRISKIDKMTDEDIHLNVMQILSKTSDENEDEINALILCMMDFNEAEFSSIFQRNIIRKGFMETITQIIYPFLNHIGILWGTSKVIPAQEHFISNLIRQKIISAIETLPLPSEDAPRIVLFLLDGEDHDISLLLASFIAKNLGWKVYYLGQKVPVTNIQKVIELTKPQLMMTIFITPRINTVTNLLEILSINENVKTLISGSSNILNSLPKNESTKLLYSPDEYISFLEQYQSSTI